MVGVLLASACLFGLPGCSSEEPPPAGQGKMSGGAMETGKMSGGAMETGKMEGQSK